MTVPRKTCQPQDMKADMTDHKSSNDPTIITAQVYTFSLHNEHQNWKKRHPQKWICQNNKQDKKYPMKAEHKYHCIVQNNIERKQHEKINSAVLMNN